MTRKLYGACLLVSAAVAAGGVRGQAPYPSGGPVSGEPAEKIPIPTGNPSHNGFYLGFEFMFLTQSWALGDQTVAYRGLVDATGNLTGLPGTYIGSGQPALTTDQFGRRSYSPGWQVTLGYKFDNGVAVYGTFLQMLDQTYSAGATNATPFFRSRPDLSDTYLVAGVFNFTPDYAGPAVDIGPDQIDFNGDGVIDGPTGNAYGIWNGAEVMDISFTQRYTQATLGARVPLFQTDYSRVYGLGGGQMSWFFERFRWRTKDTDITGLAFPQDVANYENTLSQRMYGPYIGCGHEVYLGKRLAASLDLTGAALLNVAKQRAFYELGDETTKNKRSKNEFTVVPNVNANLNLWWYPTEGVQIRVGYNAMTFFNTMYMQNPIGFNYGAIDPVYTHKAFRLVHGFNVGVGLFF